MHIDLSGKIAPPPGLDPQPLRAPIELIGARTGNCLRVAIALEETGWPYRVRRLDLARGEQRGAAHLALNPAGKVPTIRTADGLLLSQSNAILLHVAERAPGLLLPLDAAARAVALERFFYFVTDVIGVSFAAFLLRAAEQRAASLALEARANAALGHAARFLADGPFMAGAQFSLADICAYTIATAYQRHIDWAGAPQLAEWYQRLGRRPAVARGMAAFDSAAEGAGARPT